MAEAFRPYQEWLGIPAGIVRPNYYQLLGLTDGETDLEQIALAGDRATTRVRSHRPGAHARMWSELLDEIFAAKSCLLDSAKKSEYDRRLANGTQASKSPPTERVSERAAPAKAPIDSDRFPPGMAPPGARTANLAPSRTAEPDPFPGANDVAASAAVEVAAVAAVESVTPANPTAWQYGGAVPASAPSAGYVPMAVPLASYPGGYASHPSEYVPQPNAYAAHPNAYAPTAYGQPAMVPQAPVPYGNPATYSGPQAYAAPQPYGAPQAYSVPVAYPSGAMHYGAAVPPPAPPLQGLPEPMAYYGSPAQGNSASQPLDPMAPVSIPGYSGGYLSPADMGQQRIVGFAGALEMAPQAAKQEIPVGMAVPTPVTVAAPSESIETKMTAGLSQVTAVAGPTRMAAGELSEELEIRRAQQMRRNILIAGVGGGVLLVAAMLVYANLPKGGDNKVASVPEDSNPVVDAPQPMARSVESTLPGKTPAPLPAPSPAPAPQSVPAPTPAPTPVPEPMPMPTPPVVAPTPLPEPQPSPAPAPAPMPVPEPTPMPAPVPETKPVPTPEPPPPPTPTPTPTPEPMPMPPAVATAADLAALGKALTLGKAALTEQNFEEADKFIAEAESLAKSEEHRLMVARLKEIANYVRQFRQAVILSASELEAGEAFKVGTSTLVALVEATPDKIIIRHTGQNKVYPYAELPPGLAVAIADFKLDGADPVSRVVKGAFYAVAKGDQRALHEKAKTWWEEAQLGGVDIAHLMPFLTDNYDLAKGSDGAPQDAAMPAEDEDAPTKSKMDKSKAKSTKTKRGLTPKEKAEAALDE